MTTRIVELCVGDGPDRVVDRIAAMIARHAEAPAAMIHLTDDGERLHVAGAAGIPAGWKQHKPTRTRRRGIWPKQTNWRSRSFPSPTKSAY